MRTQPAECDGAIRTRDFRDETGELASFDELSSSARPVHFDRILREVKASDFAA